MSDQAQIERELIRLSDALEVASNEYADICKEAAMNRDMYDIAYAEAMLKTPKEMKVDEKKATALLSVQYLMNKAHISEAMRDAIKQRIFALSNVLNATQTRASFLKEEMRMTTYR